MRSIGGRHCNFSKDKISLMPVKIIYRDFVCNYLCRKISYKAYSNSLNQTVITQEVPHE